MPLLLIAVAIGAFAALGGPGLERAQRRAGRGPRRRAHGAAPGRDRADRAQRRARPGVDRPGPGQRCVRRTSAAPAEPIERLRSATVSVAPAVDRGRVLRGRADHLDRRHGRARDRRRRRDARGGPQLLRADGAARPLRRRHPGRARDALAAVGAADPAGLAARDHGADDRPARLPGDRRDARGARARGRGLAGLRRRRRSCCSARWSPTWRSAASARGSRSPRARDARATARRRRAAATLALLVAIGIGLHNLGEGMAIGTSFATGALALGAFLVVGFALHNTTEGLAIVAPLADSARRRCAARRLGLIAGAPAILGAWIGALAFNASLAAFLFGLGAGAIAQVIVQLAPTVRDERGPAAAPARGRRRDRGHRADVRHRPAGGDLMADADRIATRTPAPPRPSRTTPRRSTRCRGAAAASRSRAATSRRASASPRRRRRAMVKKLAELGPRRPCSLQGRRADRRRRAPGARGAAPPPPARAVPRRELGMAWDRVHDEADALEHVHQPRARAADRREARQPDARSARRPDPRRARWRSTRERRRASTRSSPGSRGRFVRVSDSDRRDAALPGTSRASRSAPSRGPRRQPFGGPAGRVRRAQARARRRACGGDAHRARPPGEAQRPQAAGRRRSVSGLERERVGQPAAALPADALVDRLRALRCRARSPR